jgi:hypothetical protein
MSWPVPDSVVNFLREKTEEYRLDKTGSINTVITQVEDDSGGYTSVASNPIQFPMGLATGIKGQQQLEQRLQDRIGNKPYFVILAPIEIDIQLESIITEVSTNRQFHVLAIENRGITLQLLQRVIVIEETPTA